MDSVEIILLTAGAVAIALVVFLVVKLPALGGDPNKSDSTDSGMGP